MLKLLPKAETDNTGWPWTEEANPKNYDSHVTWPKVTIVTPSYNQGIFIEQTIRSVLLQNYPNLEYIIMDGGSTDNTPDILKKYSRWISYWQSEKDNGQGHAINMGFSMASGDYYAWINSDDYYLKNVFHVVIIRFLKSKCDFIYGNGLNFDVNKQSFKEIKLLPFLDYFIKIPGLIQPSTFWNARIHKPIWEVLHCSLDFELWLRMVKGNSRQHVKMALSVAQAHHNNKTSDPKMKVKWEEDHLQIWSSEGHGTVREWNKIIFLNKVRMKIYKFLRII